MELFQVNGCLSDEGLQALVEGRLDDLGRLEAAEHLAYCDRCMDRYTALLTADTLVPAPRSLHSRVMVSIWARVMQSTAGRAAVAGAAAVLALTMWRSGALTDILAHRTTRLPLETFSATAELLQPEEDGPQRSFYQKFTDAVESLTGRSNAPEDRPLPDALSQNDNRLHRFFSSDRSSSPERGDPLKLFRNEE